MQEAEWNRVFESWIDEHKAILFKVARVYGATHSDREDPFQKIALQVWHSVEAYRGDCAPTTWIYRVALNTAISWSRKELRHRDKNDSLDGADAALELADAVMDPRLEWLYEQIAQLGEIDRSMALLLLDGFSYQEIADALGMSESNVGVRIHRIKTHLTRESNKESRHAI